MKKYKVLYKNGVGIQAIEQSNSILTLVFGAAYLLYKRNWAMLMAAMIIYLVISVIGLLSGVGPVPNILGFFLLFHFMGCVSFSEGIINTERLKGWKAAPHEWEANDEYDAACMYWFYLKGMYSTFPDKFRTECPEAVAMFKLDTDPEDIGFIVNSNYVER